MILRTWNYEDILPICEIEKQCFSDPWTFQMFAGGFSSPYFHGVLLEEDGKILGYACQSVLFENAEIDNVAISPDYRNKGLATMLLDELEKKAKDLGAEFSFLEVRPSNIPARCLYEKRGYQGISIRKRYYPDGEDAIVMQKSLFK